MTETQADYHTDQDSGDAHRPGAVLDLSQLVAQNDAAYWRQRYDVAAQRVAELGIALAETRAELNRVLGLLATAQAERDAARAELTTVKAQRDRLTQTLAAERRAAAVQGRR